MESPAMVEPVLTIESAGVDWLTATAYRGKPADSFKQLSDHLITQSASRGHDVRHWKAGGYHGWQSGGIATGVRHDTHIIKLSSDDAHENWREVAEASTNVSRIDVQVTMRLGREDKSFIAAQRARALASRRGKGRRPNVTLIQSTVDGDSLYLGKRSSSIYARCYDKGKEQKSDPPGILIRQELEFKSDAALDVAGQLLKVEREEVRAAEMVCTYMSGFEIQTAVVRGNFRVGARGRNDCNRVRLRWLQQSCAPTIRKLLAAGLLDDTLMALGLAEEVVSKQTKP